MTFLTKRLCPFILTTVFILLFIPAISSGKTVYPTDVSGRSIEVPPYPEHIICSGPGCLRLVTYLHGQDKVVAVDDMELRRSTFEARPYALANRQFRKYPLFGEFRGNDNPELIVSLDPLPDIIFKTFPGMGYDPEELMQKTGIPVISLNYGDLAEKKDQLYSSLRTLGKVMNRIERAEKVIAFFEMTLKDLQERTSGIDTDSLLSCFVGGIAFKGPHGIQSTEPEYPPFLYTNALNVAAPEKGSSSTPTHTNISREKLLEWDPDVIFVDVSTIYSGKEANAFWELKNSKIYSNLSAVRSKRVYGVLPYNWYSQNFGSILADAYFVGKILYPDRFADIDPNKKADEIYEFLVGSKVMEQMQQSFDQLVFKKIDL